MSYIIDRRQVSKEKSTVNRQRFLRRYREHVKKAVSDAVTKRSITDIDSGEKISIPSRDLNEPVFGHGPGGRRQRVYSGNKEFVAGDRIKRPQGGGGGQGGGQASDSGEGEDEFVFQISQEEFLHYMFEDLALPNMVKRQLAGTDSFKRVRAGYSTAGNPSQINIVRSMRSAYARRIAMGGGLRKQMRVIKDELAALTEPLSELEKTRQQELEEELLRLKRRKAAVPFLDEFDLRYNLHVKYPLPTSKAVMFCIMDVSGSMDQETKDTAKRFFILLYLFLKRNYERIEVVFIRHHSTAKEVDEQEFFYSRETGGTVVSSALRLMKEIIEDRYSPDEWNIYGAQASDGDNWNGDSQHCYSLLTESLLPMLQYYTYIEITEGDRQELWNYYERVLDRFEDTFSMRHLSDRGEIYPVFRELFSRKMEDQA